MPYYQDSVHFEQVYACLEQAYEAWQDAFEAAHGSLSEDDYEAMVASLGWQDEQPLIDFEAAIGYISYRANMSSLEDAWLANGAPDPGPYADDVFVDEVMGTMFNKDGAAMIGGTILYYAPDGDVYYIPSDNQDCSVYECIQSGAGGCNMDSVQIRKANGSSACGPYYVVEDSVEYYYNDGDRKVSWFMKFNHTGGLSGQHVFRSEIRAYKKKNGNWKRRRTALGVNLEGTAFNPEEACKEKDGETNPQVAKRRKVRRNKMKFWPRYIDYSAQDEELRGHHHFTGNLKTDWLDL